MLLTRIWAITFGIVKQIVAPIVNHYLGAAVLLVPVAIVVGILMLADDLRALGLSRETAGIIVTSFAILASVAMLGTVAVKFIDW